MKSISILLLLSFFIGSSYSQNINKNAILLIKKNTTDTSGINLGFMDKGIYLIKNGIYNFKIGGKKYPLHRIVDITNDSLFITWTTDSLTAHKFSISEIEKVIFPSLNNGVTGFPHPTMSSKKFDIKVVELEDNSFNKSKVCFNESCDDYVDAFLYIVHGYSPKYIYKEKGEYHMQDGSVNIKLVKP